MAKTTTISELRRLQTSLINIAVKLRDGRELTPAQFQAIIFTLNSEVKSLKAIEAQASRVKTWGYLRD